MAFPKPTSKFTEIIFCRVILFRDASNEKRQDSYNATIQTSVYPQSCHFDGGEITS